MFLCADFKRLIMTGIQRLLCNPCLNGRARVKRCGKKNSLPKNTEECDVQASICGEERCGLKDLGEKPFLVIILLSSS